MEIEQKKNFLGGAKSVMDTVWTYGTYKRIKLVSFVTVIDVVYQKGVCPFENGVG